METALPRMRKLNRTEKGCLTTTPPEHETRSYRYTNCEKGWKCSLPIASFAAAVLFVCLLVSLNFMSAPSPPPSRHSLGNTVFVYLRRAACARKKKGRREEGKKRETPPSPVPATYLPFSQTRHISVGSNEGGDNYSIKGIKHASERKSSFPQCQQSIEMTTM
ncbi:hypothetical protein F5Y01DRAFT_128118 [Xylaria sp. FL0043]|nr:hypothetical protein F5Y01DRAFT_128118 [Xylaria sp. FL0043]